MLRTTTASSLTKMLAAAALTSAGAAALVTGASPANAATPTQGSVSFADENVTQSWTVPANVYTISLSAVGGSGEGGNSANGASGGSGGHGAVVAEDVPVQPGQVVQIGVADDGDHGAGGFDGLGGGGNGAGDNFGGRGGRGGGATEVYVNGNLVAVAAGGGGAGGAGAVAGYNGGNGGDAGASAGSGSGGSGYGSGYGGYGAISTKKGGKGDTAGSWTFGGGGGGGGGGYIASGGGGGHQGGGSSAGGGGGGGGAAGTSFALAGASISASPYYGDGSAALSWVSGASALPAVTSDVSTAPATRAVTFTDRLTSQTPGAPAPTGSVTFQEYNLNTGTSTDLATVPVVNGVATWATSTLPVGKHEITGIYQGDDVYYPAYTGYAEVTITQPVRTLKVSTTALNFGTHAVKSQHTASFTVTNTGNVDWTWSYISTDNAAFGAPGGSCYSTDPLAPGKSCTFQIAFTPTTVGATSGHIAVVGNWPGQDLSVATRGTGVSAPVVSAISPPSGKAGTVVTVTGSNLVDVATAKLGTIAIKGLTCSSSTSCTFPVPAGSGSGHVILANSAGTSAQTAANLFSYLP